MVTYAAMFRELLVTVAVAAIVYAVVRARTRAAAVGRQQRSPRPAEVFPWRQAAWTFVALTLLIGTAIGYHQWRARQEVLLVRVVNGATGEVATYRARRGAIRARAFETVDGRIVTLAETERLEVLDRPLEERP
ncbi:hypothetical protein [Inmirania thermothiophila]|uniref:Uncharacterized protein n=1 Tax=Inmirania thermothiophila TaxID=1750597 RepID=A0A3N1Y204_9GAMM|nr:hypothetical protein [Inmirania thermothiophila]ROR32551.1 hypothetical protein EDC57_1753 [Inmirania thermothiophila]